MAYKFREEIVGKRFLSVSGFTKLKVNKIIEWGWRTGVIRAASHRDNDCHDLQILVEYDDVEWQRREWLSPHRDAVFSFFLVEKGLYWAERTDPRHASLIAIDHHNNANNNHHHHRINGKPLRGSTAAANTVAWPALTFYPLVARAELPEDAMPIEFMQDRRLDFVDYSKLKPFTQDWELTKGSLPWVGAVRRWAEMQDGQRILLTTPSVLVGFRVEVYRAEGTTQWYTAVIVGYNESTKDLTVTDDTVLEDHNEDPSLVQMRLIGDGVVESIMRGEVVGMTPRRSRSSTALTHALVVPRPGRRPRGRPGNTATLQTTPRVQSPISQHLEKDKSTARNNRRRRISEGAGREKTEKDSEPVLSTRQEDRENKGPSTGRFGNRLSRTTLEETNSGTTGNASKLRKRAVTLRTLLESVTKRTVRRKLRPCVQKSKRETDELDRRRTVVRSSVSSKEEERLGGGSAGKSKQEEEEGQEEETEHTEEEEEKEGREEREHCDPLSKRLKTSPVSRKLRSDRKSKNSEESSQDREVDEREEVAEIEKKEKEEGSNCKKEEVKDRDGVKRHVGKPEEDEESRSRERDQEPEPPPPERLDPGGKSPKNPDTLDREKEFPGEPVLVNGSLVDSELERKKKEGREVVDDENASLKSSPVSSRSSSPRRAKAVVASFVEEEEDEEKAAVAEREENDGERRKNDRKNEREEEEEKKKEEGKGEDRGARRQQRSPRRITVPSNEELGTEDSVGSASGTRAASVESVVELLESSSQDSGSVLERLSPLSSGGGGAGRQNNNLLLEQQQREQERSRHNESPVILAERLNKPPPPVAGQHHHHLHQQQQQQQQQQQYHHHRLHHHHQQQQQQQHLHQQGQQHQAHQQQPYHHHPAAYHHQQRYTADSPVIHHHLHHQQQQQQQQSAVNQHQQHQQQQHRQQLASSPQQHHQQHHHLSSVSLLEVQQQSHGTRGGDESGLMEVEAGAGIHGTGVLGGAIGVRGATVGGGVAGGGGGGVVGGVGGGAASVAAGAYGDSGSDSGVSSLRSAGSGDERSGSRSSALSVEESTTSSSTPNAAATPARVWHVQSVQHTSLLMAHPQAPPNAGSGSAAAAATAPPVAYQNPAPPGHHHPAVASEMLWRPPRYPPLSHALLGPAQPSPEELLERDRHERMIR